MNVYPTITSRLFIVFFIVPTLALPGRTLGTEAGRNVQDEAASASVENPTRADDEGIEQPPPTIIDKVLEQILVERDLDAAHTLLVASLTSALGNAHNPGWIARIYSLLAVIDLYQGDDALAERYLWRAVTLNPNIQLESQLGDAPTVLLRQIHDQWVSLKQDGVMTFSALPAGLALFVDGQRHDTPGTVHLKPGDHLVQVDSTMGVIARKWVTIEAGRPLENPPPIPLVLKSLGERGGRRALSDDELFDAMRKASTNAKVVTDIVGDLMDHLEEAVDAKRIDRAACFQEHLEDAGRIAGEVRGFAARLDVAAKENDGDEVLHLVEMTSLAAEQARETQSKADTCYDIVDASAPPEVRVLEAPAGPAPDASEKGNGVEAQPWQVSFFRPSVPDDAARFYLLRPDDTAFADIASDIARAGTGTLDQSMQAGWAPVQTRALRRSRFWWFAGVWADGVVDTNPERRPTGTAAGESEQNGGGGEPGAEGGDQGGGDRAEAVAAISPAIVVGGRRWFSGVRYPLRLGTREVLGRDLEAVARGTLAGPAGRTVAGRFLVTRDTFSPVQLAGQFGAFERTVLHGRVEGSVLPPGAFHLGVYGQTGMETHRLREAATTLALGTVGVGASARWQVFPRSAILAGAALSAGALNERPSAGSPLFAGEEHTRFASRFLVGFSGQVLPSMAVTGWAGPQFTTAGAGAAPRYNLGIADSVVGEAIVSFRRGPLRAWLKGGRVITQEVFADVRVADRAVLGLEVGGEGWLQVEARCQAGREHFFMASDPNADPVMVPARWWPVQRFAGGDLTARFRLEGPVRSLEFRVVYGPLMHWGVPAVLGASMPSGSDRIVVHQAFAGVYAPF